MDIGVDGKAGARQDARRRFDIGAIETNPFGQLEPALDPAGGSAVTVMVDEAGAPVPSQLGCGKPGDQCCIFDRYLLLVIEPVERPGLHLATVKLAAVQQLMKGVTVVVALRTDRTKRCFQLFSGQQRSAHGVSPIIKGANLLRGAPLPCRATPGTCIAA